MHYSVIHKLNFFPSFSFSKTGVPLFQVQLFLFQKYYSSSSIQPFPFNVQRILFPPFFFNFFVRNYSQYCFKHSKKYSWFSFFFLEKVEKLSWKKRNDPKRIMASARQFDYSLQPNYLSKKSSLLIRMRKFFR